MIAVKNLTKKFGSLKAVDNISFSINKGEVVGLLGPNGAGKTTIMRILAGFLSADSGSITVDDIDVEKYPIKAQRKIGYLPENNPLYKNMQVAEFLELAAQLHQVKGTDKKDALDFVVKAVGIENVYYHLIGELSKGYKQRVGIAAAIIHRPKIIILDEPTEGLDPNQRTEIRQLIRNLSKDHTIITSTHVMQEASAICSHMLIINKGKIIADGKPEELAKLSQKELVLNLEIEGEQVEEKLRILPEVKELRIIGRYDGKIKLEITPKTNQPIEPLIAQKIWDNKWVVWKLERQESNLEEIFQALTKE